MSENSVVVPVAKVLASDGLAADAVAALKEKGIDVEVCSGLSVAELKERLPGVQALVIRSATRATEEILAAAPDLKLIVRAGSGVDNIELPAAAARKVVVMNTPGANGNAVAELVLSFICVSLRLLSQAQISMRDGLWEKKKFKGSEFSEKTLGIIGYGKIGKMVAEKARTLGMPVIAYDAFNFDSITARAQGVEYKEQDEVLRTADILTFHVPKLPETVHLVNKDSISRMREGAYIINTSRGEVVAADDLLDGLDSGKLSGAALDVFESEPLEADSPLRSHAKIILTPHIAASTSAAQQRVGAMVASQISGFFLNGTCVNVVNAK